MTFRAHKLRDLANLAGGELVGDGDVCIRGAAAIQEAGEGHITFLASSGYEKYLETTRASAIIAPRGVRCSIPTITADDPYLAFAKVLEVLAADERPVHPRGVHPSAVVDRSAFLGEAVSVGPYCQIGGNARVGRGSVLMLGCYVGDGATVGEDCLVYPHVTIRERCEVGCRVILHPGVVIGADGFGFARDGAAYRKVPQIGRVVIEDDVEIGANSTVDRATTGVTRIGRGVKIDNLVMVAHNVVIGANSVLAGQVGIAGSAEIGEGVVLGGQVGVVGHIKVGDGVTVGAQSGVSKSYPPGKTISGYPAREHKVWKRLQAYLSRLPEMHDKIKDLTERVEKLEK